MSTTAPDTTLYVNGQPIDEDAVPEQDAPTIIEQDDVDEPREHDGQLDDIEIQVAHRDWTVEGDFTVRKRDGSDVVEKFSRRYIQKPLSFTAMLQFTGLIGEKIAESMSGPDGITLDGVLAENDGIIGMGRAMLTSQDFAGVDSFVKGLAKLSTYAPSVIEDCQCIWLRVPPAERPIVKDIWGRSPEDGGLTFAEGQEMLEVFLSQNYSEVEDFFVERLRHLVGLVRKLRTRKTKSRIDRSQPLRPSNTSAAPTQNP